METFSALLAICAGNSSVPSEFPTQRPVTRSFNIFFDMRLNKSLNKQSWGWWYETLSSPLWRYRNVLPPLISHVSLCLACNILLLFPNCGVVVRILFNLGKIGFVLCYLTLTLLSSRDICIPNLRIWHKLCKLCWAIIFSSLHSTLVANSVWYDTHAPFYRFMYVILHVFSLQYVKPERTCFIL